MLAGHPHRVPIPQPGRRTRYDNDQDQNDDAGNDAHAHLHVLPPHLLPDPVGAPAEALSRRGEVICLVLQVVNALATLVGHVDVVPHRVDGGLHGLWRRMMSAIVHLHIEAPEPIIRSTELAMVESGSEWFSMAGHDHARLSDRVPPAPTGLKQAYCVVTRALAHPSHANNSVVCLCSWLLEAAQHHGKNSCC